jgi:CheY-like chemotaxis protein
MDLQMPELDGYEASRRIRSIPDPYFREIPILALTASAMIDTKEKVISSGMNDFITKPFQPEELKEKIGLYVLSANTKPPKATPYSDSLNFYSDGDTDFKREFASHLIKNIKQLKTIIEEAVNLEDGEVYFKTVHMVKPTISMLGDEEFTATIENIKAFFIKQDFRGAEVRSEISRFNVLANQVIEGLEEEIQSL